ncbi:MAG TPA: CHAP domain-containing protein [Candidatus Saccharimonadales bacterium]|nr:CHAP domain-containing protein [Candidatus Saccharimonadales bacterium]
MAASGPVYAEDGGYPFASYHGPGTSPANSTWTDSKGNPISPYGYYFRNCTDYVAWKLQSLGVADGKTRSLGNAAAWSARAKGKNLTVDGSPSVGAAAISTAGTYGHVGFVEETHSDGTITISEYNYKLDGTYSTRSGTPSRLGFTQFIHFEKLMASAAIEPAPPRVPWYFETIDGDPGSLGRTDHNAGQSPAAVSYGDSLQLFYYDEDQHALHHAWADSSGWHFEYLDGTGGSSGRVNYDVGRTPYAVVFGNALHVFYYDAANGNVRHAWSNDSGWHFETLDGDSGSISHAALDVGIEPVAVVYGTSLQLFYFNASAHTLRHAWMVDQGWHFETLDGDVGALSRYTGDVGRTSCAVVFAGGLHVYAYDQSGGHLRHEWSDTNGWHFENLDGDRGSIGHQDGPVGAYSAVTMYGGTMQLFYYDQAHGALRHAWASEEKGWQFESLEGSTSFRVGAMPSVTAIGDSIQVFYYDSTFGNLRHAWTSSTTGWQFENLDGAGGDNPGRLKADVGYDAVALNFNETLHVFYFDNTNGNLRHSRPY